MEIRHLIYFETIAHYKNVTKAARELSVAQPALSQQIRSLEEEIGFTLFVRSKTGVELTDKGEVLLKRVHPVLQQFHDLVSYVEDIRNSPMENITIATLPSLVELIGGAFKRLWLENPNIHVSLREGQARTVNSLVERGGADFGITRLPIKNGNFEYEVLGSDPIYTFIREDDPLRNKARVLPQDLKNRCLTLVQSSSGHSGIEQINRAFQRCGIEPRVIGHVESGSSLLTFVRSGPGVGLAPLSCALNKSEGVKVVPFDVNDIDAPIAIVWMKNESNPAGAHIRNLIIEYFKDYFHSSSTTSVRL